MQILNGILGLAALVNIFGSGVQKLGEICFVFQALLIGDMTKLSCNRPQSIVFFDPTQDTLDSLFRVFGNVFESSVTDEAVEYFEMMSSVHHKFLLVTSNREPVL